MMDIFVVVVGLLLLLLREEEGPGVDVRETGLDFGLGLGRPRSETRVPAADGGGLDGWGGGVAALAGVDVPDLPDM